MSEYHLKPCPFCGGPADFEQVERLGIDTWSVGCRATKDDDPDECIAQQFLMTFTRKVEAAAAWNKRATIIDQPPAPKIDLMVEAVPPENDSLGMCFRREDGTTFYVKGGS